MYRKFRADRIFDGEKFVEDKKVLVTEVSGKIVEIIDSEDAGDDIETYTGILSPGFINCHCHLELSHMRNKIPEGAGLVGFVSRVMSSRFADERVILDAMEKAEMEMIENGIVAVGDICNTPFSLPQKLKHNLEYYNFVEATGFIESNAGDRFAMAEILAKKFEVAGPTAIVPHAPYSVSKPLFGLISKQPPGRTLTMHNQESESENEFFLTGEGEFRKLYKDLDLDISFFKPPQQPSLEYIMDNFSYQGNIIFVHNVHTDENQLIYASEVENFWKANFFWCLCPNANLFISGILPNLDPFLIEDVSMVFGTDSLASNKKLSILEEMKVIEKFFFEINTEMMLKWATSNGAKALQMYDRIGSFEKGKQPGLIVIDQLNDGEISQESTVKKLL